MCFIIPPSWPNSKRATKDILVQKLVAPIKEGQYTSMHFYFVYENGYEYSNDNFKRIRKNYKHTSKGRAMATREGLHSYKVGRKSAPDQRFGRVLIDCYIPKGAQYFYNQWEGQYFSNKLVIVGRTDGQLSLL